MIEAELADGTIMEFPEGTDPAVIQNTVKRMIGGQSGANPQPANQQQPQIPQGIPSVSDVAGSEQTQPQGFSVAETISNIPSSALQLGKDIVEPILSPIETAKSLGKLGTGALFKANEALDELTPDALDFMSEPLFGDSVLGSENAPAAEAVGAFIDERYGSLDAFKNTVQQDPVGVLADAAAIFAGGSTLLPKTGKAGRIGAAVEGVGKAVDPLNIATSSVKALAKSGRIIPEALPAKLLESAVKFRPGVKNAERANMISTSLKQGIMPTVDGLNKITEKIGVLNTRLDKIIDGATTRGVEIPKGVIFSELKKVRGKLGGVKVDAAADLRIIDQVAKNLNENLKGLKKGKVTPRELQDLKTNAYKKINFDVTQGQAGFAKNEARKGIAKAAKTSLEGIDSSVQPINKDIGNLLELNKELEGVVNKLDNRNLISLDTAAKIGAGAGSGAAAGSPIAGTVIGTVAAVAGNPRVKARTALVLENIRKNAATVELANNSLPPVLARALATQAGRINEALNAQLEEDE